jgi:hypothetical protein
VVATVLPALLAVDAAFVALHASYDPAAAGLLADPSVRLGRDGTYPEMFGYGQLAAAAALMLACYRRRGERVYLTWAVVLLAVVADDALTIHERAGAAIAPTLPVVVSDLPYHDGEFVALASIGALLVALVLLVHRASGPQARAESRRLLALLAMLGMFAFVVDRLHTDLTGSAAEIAGMIEDGGELAVMSAILAYAVSLAARHGGREKGVLRHPARGRVAPFLVARTWLSPHECLDVERGMRARRRR